MKKYISGLLAGIIIATSLTAFAAAQLKVIPNPYPVFVDGTKANVQGYNINGSTYLKLSDLKSAGIDAKYNKDKKQIEVKMAVDSTSKAEPTTDYEGNSSIDFSDAETISKTNPTILFEGDNFEITTLNGMKAIRYKNGTYVCEEDLSKRTGIISRLNGDIRNTISLYKDGTVILKSDNADIKYYIGYKGFRYINIEFLGEYLEI